TGSKVCGANKIRACQWLTSRWKKLPHRKTYEPDHQQRCMFPPHEPRSADFQSISISMNRFISRGFLAQTPKAVHATFASPTPLAGCDVAKRLECGVSRRLSLPNSQGARITNSSATTKAAGYAALQTLRAMGCPSRHPFDVGSGNSLCPMVGLALYYAR